jgi:hypothetical protein
MTIDASALAFDDATGRLYVIMDSQLVTLDPTTGATTLLGLTSATSGLEVVGACPLPPIAVPAVGPLALLSLVPSLGATAGAVALHLRRRA